MGKTRDDDRRGCTLAGYVHEPLGAHGSKAIWGVDADRRAQRRGVFLQLAPASPLFSSLGRRSSSRHARPPSAWRRWVALRHSVACTPRDERTSAVHRQ